MSTPTPLSTAAPAGLALDDPSPFLLQVRVDAGDCDAQGHVNNSVYVRWMDFAAYAHSESLGYDWACYQKLGASFVVRRHEIDYLSPAYDGNELLIATWPGTMERFTAYRHHQIVRVADGQTLLRASTKWIYVELATARPRRIPADLIAAFHPRPRKDSSSLS
ncbi:MAG: acyl-CoA thioesterase [Phycisphaeraceae bacterium]|nr:acyl-CoA thioesterase [Phycisphaeraceae bacterium]